MAPSFLKGLKTQERQGSGDKKPLSDVDGKRQRQRKDLQELTLLEGNSKCGARQIESSLDRRPDALCGSDPADGFEAQPTPSLGLL